METTHLIAIIPLIISSLIMLFVWRKGLCAFINLLYCLFMALAIMSLNWEWYPLPLIAILAIISLVVLIKRSMEGDLI